VNISFNYLISSIQVVHELKDKMSGACSTHGSDGKCIQYFDWKT